MTVRRTEYRMSDNGRVLNPDEFVQLVDVCECCGHKPLKFATAYIDSEDKIVSTIENIVICDNCGHCEQENMMERYVRLIKDGRRYIEDKRRDLEKEVANEEDN